MGKSKLALAVSKTIKFTQKRLLLTYSFECRVVLSINLVHLFGCIISSSTWSLGKEYVVKVHGNIFSSGGGYRKGDFEFFTILLFSREDYCQGTLVKVVMYFERVNTDEMEKIVKERRYYDVCVCAFMFFQDIIIKASVKI